MVRKLIRLFGGLILLFTVSAVSYGQNNTERLVKAQIAARQSACDALVRHAMLGMYEEVKYDLSLGADPNCIYSKGYTTPLMAALLYTPDLFEYDKYYRTILLLLDAGADVNQPDGTGRTPLLEAVRVEDIQVARELLNRGAIVSAEDQNGLTPVIHAISRGNKRMVKMLVEKEPATAHLATKTGDTPLMFAVAGGYKKIVKYLVLERYVDVKAKNNQGKTAYTIAVEKGHRAIAEFLARQEHRYF